MHYSACLPAIYSGKPIDEALAGVAAAGLNHYEFWGWNESQLDEYLAAQEKYGLMPVTFCTTFHELTDPNGRDAYVAGIQETIAACRKLGCGTMITQVGAERTDSSRAEQHQSIVEGLRAAAPLLEESGITLLFEPLNTRVDHPGYYLWSMEEAIQIAEEVSSPNVKILCDLYHQAVMDDLDIDQITANLDKIGHFHMAGHPGRHEPHFDSVVDYKTILGAIRKAGYTGAVGLEYFPVRPAQEGLNELVKLLLTY